MDDFQIIRNMADIAREKLDSGNTSEAGAWLWKTLKYFEYLPEETKSSKKGQVWIEAIDEMWVEAFGVRRNGS